jgi:PAS domain S-box-containing protein
MITDSLQFEALFAYATIGAIITDKKGNIIQFNKYAETQFGYRKDEVIGKTVDILVPSKNHSIHHKHRETFYKNPKPGRMGKGKDIFAQKKDGTLFPVEITLSNYEIDGEIFVIAFVIDITALKKSEAVVLEQKNELKRVETENKKSYSDLEQKIEHRTHVLRATFTELEKSKAELNEALEKEKELNELKSRFLTTASHEFRTPLSTILSSSFLLEKYNEINDAAKIGKHINYIKSAVDDMKLILEDFLSLGKLEEGLIKINIVEFASAELFSEIRNINNEMERHCKKGQQILFRHSGLYTARVDIKLLKNIMVNLISNAIKFSPENSVININCELQKQNFLVSVKDNGIGISEEDRLHLFERFFRAKNAVNIQGTGLGLHIVTKYLELMNGYIQIESNLNRGTVFTFTIPQ